jgi:exosortase E/protease (VPEID-CTERM system)
MRLSSRLGVVAAVLFLEKFILNFFVDFTGPQASHGIGTVVRVAQHWGFRFLVTMAISLALFTYVRDRERLAEADSAAVGAALRPKWLLLHAVLILLLAVASFPLYHGHLMEVAFASLLGLWLLAAFTSVVTLFAGMAPWTLWRKGAQEVGILWLYALIVGAISASVMEWSQSLWAGMARITFEAVHYVLAPLIPTLQTNPATLIIDTGRFAVIVSGFCSGLEGMSLMLVFCGVWLVLFRKEYRFPRALILIPAGLLLIFVLNVLRIATLVLIGHAGLESVAIYGFHSQAGWIAFNAAAGLIAFASRKSSWLSPTLDRAGSVATENPTAAYLMPFLAILAAGMMARALSTGFEVLYLLRPLAATLALAWYWSQLRTLEWSMSWRGPAVGAAVFVVWGIAAHFLLQQEAMPVTLAAMPAALRATWIGIRVLAAIVIVPVAEELAFRGFLLRRLVATDFGAVRFQSVGAVALLVSSIAFGLGHGAMWLPGIVAGVLYGALLIRTGSMGEAVGAHATTNVLVACWVLSGNQWQLWS